MIVLPILISLAAPGAAYAHCDTMDGPVVKAAQKALATGNVKLVLLWVRPEDEPEIRSAFDKTLQTRDQSPQVREQVDRYFLRPWYASIGSERGLPTPA
jgi:hypothetical protein